MVAAARSTQPGTVRLEGEIDMHSIPRLEAAFADVVAAGGSISVDMADVTFIDSAGLHFLARLASSMNCAPPLALLNVPPRVVRVMEIVGMTELPTIELRSEA